MTDRTNPSLTRAQDVIQELKEVSSSFERVVVAFSGGMDSTLALFLSLQALGKEKVISCTVDWDIYFPSLAFSFFSSGEC